MSINNEAVVQLIRQGIPDARVEVTGDGYKYQAEIISTAFVGLNKLNRQKLVYSTLTAAITSGELHALTMTVLTPDEKSAD